jgi:hypothetical protein
VAQCHHFGVVVIIQGCCRVATFQLLDAVRALDTRRHPLPQMPGLVKVVVPGVEPTRAPVDRIADMSSTSRAAGARGDHRRQRAGSRRTGLKDWLTSHGQTMDGREAGAAILHALALGGILGRDDFRKGSWAICHLKIASVEVSVSHQNTSRWQECCDQRDNEGTRRILSGLAFAPALDGPFQWR